MKLITMFLDIENDNRTKRHSIKMERKVGKHKTCSPEDVQN